MLSAFSAGIAIASRLFVPGPDGRPTATITSEIEALGWPLWLPYVVVFALTLLIGARLVLAVLQVAIATRRRRAHHRMVVDLRRASRRSGPRAPGRLRILDVAQPLAYCLPGVRSRVVVSEGTLNALADNEITAILTHERAHLRARHDLVLEMFTAVHAAFPRFVRSANALDAVRLLIEMLADDAAVRAAGPTPLARALVACAAGRTPSGALAAGGPTTVLRVRRLGGRGRTAASSAAAAYLGRGRRAGGAHRRAGRAVADRTAPTVHRVARSARQNTLCHNKKRKAARMSSSESLTTDGTAQIGVTGLAVMGSNIARNFAHHGYTVALHNRSIAKTDALLAEHGSEGKFVRSETIPEFLAALEKPRRVLIMVKAGDPTDAVINELADAMEEGDIIIDGGNALYTDTIRREKVGSRGDAHLHRLWRERRGSVPTPSRCLPRPSPRRRRAHRLEARPPRT